jgi:hypothetical protein
MLEDKDKRGIYPVLISFNFKSDRGSVARNEYKRLFFDRQRHTMKFEGKEGQVREDNEGGGRTRGGHNCALSFRFGQKGGEMKGGDQDQEKGQTS